MADNLHHQHFTKVIKQYGVLEKSFTSLARSTSAKDPKVIAAVDALKLDWDTYVNLVTEEAEALAKKLISAQQTITDLEAKLVIAKKETQDATTGFTGSLDELKARGLELKALAEKIEELEKKLKEEQEASHDISVKLVGAEQEVDRLTTADRATDKAITDLQIEADADKDQIATQKTLIESYEKRINNFEAERTSATLKYEQDKKAMSRELRRLSAELDVARRQAIEDITEDSSMDKDDDEDHDQGQVKRPDEKRTQGARKFLPSYKFGEPFDMYASLVEDSALLEGYGDKELGYFIFAKLDDTTRSALKQHMAASEALTKGWQFMKAKLMTVCKRSSSATAAEMALSRLVFTEGDDLQKFFAEKNQLINIINPRMDVSEKVRKLQEGLPSYLKKQINVASISKPFTSASDLMYAVEELYAFSNFHTKKSAKPKTEPEATKIKGAGRTEDVGKATNGKAICKTHPKGRHSFDECFGNPNRVQVNQAQGVQTPDQAIAFQQNQRGGYRGGARGGFRGGVRGGNRGGGRGGGYNYGQRFPSPQKFEQQQFGQQQFEQRYWPQPQYQRTLAEVLENAIHAHEVQKRASAYPNDGNAATSVQGPQSSQQGPEGLGFVTWEECQRPNTQPMKRRPS